jgi:hypothetical protein
MAGKLGRFETMHVQRGGQFHMSEDCDLLGIVLSSEGGESYASDEGLTTCRYLDNMHSLDLYTLTES